MNVTFMIKLRSGPTLTTETLKNVSEVDLADVMRTFKDLSNLKNLEITSSEGDVISVHPDDISYIQVLKTK